MARYRVELLHYYRHVEVVEVEMSNNYSYNLATCDELWDKARQLADPHGWDELPEWDGEDAEIADCVQITERKTNA